MQRHTVINFSFPLPLPLLLSNKDNKKPCHKSYWNMVLLTEIYMGICYSQHRYNKESLHSLCIFKNWFCVSNVFDESKKLSCSVSPNRGTISNGLRGSEVWSKHHTTQWSSASVLCQHLDCILRSSTWQVCDITQCL